MSLQLSGGKPNLNLCQTAELAALVSAHSTHLIEGTSPVPDAQLQRYWHHARNRLHSWMRCLNGQPVHVPGSSAAQDRAAWERSKPIIQEIFVSEILTRIWTAVLTAADRRRHIRHAEPLVRSTLVGHLEARHLALSRMVNGPGVSISELSQVDRLRRRSERWTDLLLGHLVKQYGLGEFAIEERRALDFGNNQIGSGIDHSPSVVWDFILAGLQLAFPKSLVVQPPHQDDHDGIIRSVIACFPPNAFQPTGPFQSVLGARIRHSSLHPEGPPRQPAESRTTTRPPRESQALPPSSTGINFSKLRRRFDVEF